MSKWYEQCMAARRIRQHFGVQPALDYLIGEKFSTFVRIAERNQNYRAVLAAFIAELGGVFTDDEIRRFLSKRKGSESRLLRQFLQL